jgi:ribosomal-protein-serine acetyltransferase
MDEELKTYFQVDDHIALRAWTENDVDRALEIVLRNREHLQSWMQWMTPDYSVEASKKFIADGIANRIERKTLALAILEDNRMVGSTGFNRLDWVARVCEIGYWIDRDEEGKGIITRACRTMIDYAFDSLEMNRVEIRCSTENVRSAAVPERLGFKKEGVLRQAEMLNGRAHDFCIYGLLAEDPRLW